MAQSSSCKVSYSLSGKTIDIECQACYKKKSCFILSYKMILANILKKNKSRKKSSVLPNTYFLECLV